MITFAIFCRHKDLSPSGIIAITALFASFIVLTFATGAQRKNILLLLCSVIFSLYIIECTLHFFLTPKERRVLDQVVRQTKIRPDTRTALEFVADMVRDGNPAAPFIPPKSFTRIVGLSLFPLSALSRIQTVFCNDYGIWQTYLSDQHGFNNPVADYSVNANDAVIVGDSFVNGHCVPWGEDVGSFLRLGGVRCLNLGMAGNGPLIELGVITEYAERLKPKTVFWCYFEGNDLNDLQDELASNILPDYLNDDFSQNLMNRQQELDDLLREHVAAASKNPPETTTRPLTSILFLRNIRSRLGFSFFKDHSDALQNTFYSIIGKANTRVNSWGGQMVFVYLPTYQTIFDKSTDATRALFLERIRLQGITVIDMAQEFRQMDDPLEAFPFRLPGHYSSTGYRRLAEAFLHFLKKDKPVTRNFHRQDLGKRLCAK
ncbi:MAG: hypothetical protein KKF77_15200 [Proteobacteria bacterium]|nr:hypothetical protein [Pseudomonadota bacterium]